MAIRIISTPDIHISASRLKQLQAEYAQAFMMYAGTPPDFEEWAIAKIKYVNPVFPGVIADWTNLPFAADSFGAVFADPPWNLSQMKSCADFCKEALRVAPVAYLMSPWLWVNREAKRTAIWVREFPGVNVPILLVRYERATTQLYLTESK